jgi:hypothetical protein
MQGSLALSKLGFPLLEAPIAIAQLGVAMAQFGVFLDVSDQLLLNKIDEKIDFLLAITTLANARSGERDIMNIGRSESHVLLPKS